MRLTLFMPRFYGLHTFDQKGTVSREVAIYNALHERGMDIHFITYGPNDLKYQAQLPFFPDFAHPMYNNPKKANDKKNHLPNLYPK